MGKRSQKIELEDVPIVQEWISWGREEALRLAREERLTSVRQVLLVIVQGLFPDLLDLAKQAANQATDSKVLYAAIVKVALAHDNQQAALQALGELASEHPVDPG